MERMETTLAPGTNVRIAGPDPHWGYRPCEARRCNAWTECLISDGHALHGACPEHEGVVRLRLGLPASTATEGPHDD